jgi:hypothetical protein
MLLFSFSASEPFVSLASHKYFPWHRMTVCGIAMAAVLVLQESPVR